MHSLHATVSPHPNPSPKEKGLIKSEVEVLSFGEDLGEANRQAAYFECVYRFNFFDLIR